MNTVRIKCPKCSVLLEVRNSKNEAVKSIKCPKCGSVLQIRFRVEKEEEKPIPVDAGIDEEETSLETVLPTTHFSKAMFICDGLRYELNVGMNVVGRSSSQSTANVQIQCGDIYMSRSHANVNVVKTSSGKLRCIITNGNNKNPIFINGVKLEKDDEVILSHDDEIKMGNTLMRFALEK